MIDGNTSYSVVNKSQVPQSISYLAQYSAAKGLLPMGSATGSNGVAYVGLKKTEIGGE